MKVTADGTSDYLRATLTTPYAQPVVLILAAKHLGSGSKRILSRNTATMFVEYRDGNVLGLSAGTTVSQGGYTGQASEHVLAVLFDDTQYQSKRGWKARKDGADMSSQGWTSHGTNSLDGLTLFADHAPGNFCNAEAYELIVATVTAGATRADVIDDLQRCEWYLRNKFGI